MPISALPAISVARNGVGVFIPQCKRIDLHYSDWGGSSRGMKAFLKSALLLHFAKAHPQIQLHASPRGNEHPLLIAHYINGRRSEVCVRNLQKEQIFHQVQMLSDTSGSKEKRVTGGKNVESLNQSVRGVWDEYHDLDPVRRTTLQDKVEQVGRGLLGRKKKQK